MNERIESLTKERAIFFANVQPAAPRLSIPSYLCELYGWGYDDTITLTVERRGKVFHGRYAMSSGYEIVPKRDERELLQILKPGERVKVTVSP